MCVLCGSVCLVCCLCNNSTEKGTMLDAETRLPSCVYKTNKPCSYLNWRVTRECECSSDQTTTATVVCRPDHSSNGSLTRCSSVCLMVLHPFKWLASSVHLNLSKRLPVNVSVCKHFVQICIKKVLLGRIWLTFSWFVKISQIVCLILVTVHVFLLCFEVRLLL